MPVLTTEFIVEIDVQADLNRIKANLLDGMREYMTAVAEDGDDPGYTESDIGKCEVILDGFLAQVVAAGTGNSDQVMSAVKGAVLALNELNASCDHSLIETDQREQICELIIQASAAAGVGSGEDMTEQWREW